MYDHHVWSSYMIIIYYHHILSSYIIIICYPHILLSYTTIIYYYHIPPDHPKCQDDLAAGGMFWNKESTLKGSHRWKPNNREHIREFPNISKNMCSPIWHLGGSSRVQNTPTGCGNDLPTRPAHLWKVNFSKISGTYTPPRLIPGGTWVPYLKRGYAFAQTPAVPRYFGCDWNSAGAITHPITRHCLDAPKKVVFFVHWGDAIQIS